MVWIIIRSTDKKRVRLLNGELTPVFEYHTQALKYANFRNINNCLVVQKIKKRKN